MLPRSGVFSYSLFWLSVGIFAPFAIVAFSYCRIFLTLRRMRGSSSSDHISPANSQQFPSTTNSATTDIVLVQRRFTARNPIISDNNLDTLSRGPYHKHSYPTEIFNFNNGRSRTALAAIAKKKTNLRTAIFNRSRSVQDEIKLIRTLFITVLAFALGWSLFIVLLLLQTPNWMPRWVYVLRAQCSQYFSHTSSEEYHL